MEPPSVPRHERHDAVMNRARILAAARREFAQRGLDAEMKDIAAAADVGVGTLYRHFESRDGLIAALIEETSAELLGRLRAAADGEPAAAFRAMLLAAADVIGRFGALIEVAMSRRLADDASGKRSDEFATVLDALLRRGVAEGAFRPDLDIELTHAVVEAVFVSGAFVALARARGFEAAADGLADALLAGMAAGVVTSS